MYPSYFTLCSHVKVISKLVQLAAAANVIKRNDKTIFTHATSTKTKHLHHLPTSPITYLPPPSPIYLLHHLPTSSITHIPPPSPTHLLYHQTYLLHHPPIFSTIYLSLPSLTYPPHQLSTSSITKLLPPLTTYLLHHLPTSFTTYILQLLLAMLTFYSVCEEFWFYIRLSFCHE